MSDVVIGEDMIQKVIAFHGHWCPGLAIGIRAAELALKEVGKASDEEIVAVVETDMCAVDAIQYLTGCTFGKGNLVHRDYGKSAFTFYRRRDNKAVRIVSKPLNHEEAGKILENLNEKLSEKGLTDREKRQWEEIRNSISKKIMASALSDLFEVKAAQEPVPHKARMLASLTCASCGESTMETRARHLHGKVLCIPCYKKELRS